MKKIFYVLSAVTLLVSCKKEEHQHEHNENEMITAVVLHTKEKTSGKTQSFTWSDKDGQGGNPPEIDIVTLDANKVYEVNLEVLDETKTPVANITAEIRREGDHHRFYYVAQEVQLNFSELDTDENGLPLGITATVEAGDAGTGSLRIVLRHYASEGKAADDAVNNPKSSSDIDVTFPVTLE